MNKKENKMILNSRVKNSEDSLELKNNQDENLKIYKDLKEQLKYNLKDEIENKIQRMKILYEIKEKELYKYDGFRSFEHFIKSYVIAKSQAYVYLKVYEKVLEGTVSIDKIREVGFRRVTKYIRGEEPLEVNQGKEIIKEYNKKDVPIRILVKDEEVYDFCKEDTKRLYFIIEYIFKNKKDILMEGISQYEKYRKEKRKK